MKRYGDNIPSNCIEESETHSGETKYLAGNCAVRQDMVAFLMPVMESPDIRKPHDIFSFFRLWQKKTKTNSG